MHNLAMGQFKNSKKSHIVNYLFYELNNIERWIFSIWKFWTGLPVRGTNRQRSLQDTHLKFLLISSKVSIKMYWYIDWSLVGQNQPINTMSWKAFRRNLYLMILKLQPKFFWWPCNYERKIAKRGLKLRYFVTFLSKFYPVLASTNSKGGLRRKRAWVEGNRHEWRVIWSWVRFDWNRVSRREIPRKGLSERKQIP